jgi:hypothetical protein
VQGRNNGLRHSTGEHYASQDYSRTDRRRLAHRCRRSARFRRGGARYRYEDAPGFHHGGNCHGSNYGGYGLGGLYFNTGVSDCLQQQWVQTGRGTQLRTVNVCTY